MMTSLILGVIGLMAIFLEFWLPGGVMALFGLSLMSASLVFAFMIDWRWGMVLLQFQLVAVVIVIVAAIKSLKKKKMCLTDSQENYKGCAYNKECLGKEAKVIKDLKPSGLIEIGGEHFQALSEGDYLKSGTIVTVIGGEGFHLIVR
jgi:membrane-bound serine protease (ClpP class)